MTGTFKLHNTTEVCRGDAGRFATEQYIFFAQTSSKKRVSVTDGTALWVTSLKTGKYVRVFVSGFR